MSLALLVPTDATTPGEAAAVAALRAAVPTDVEILIVGPHPAGLPGTRSVPTAGPTANQRLVAAAQATSAVWLAWCPLARVGVPGRFQLQADIGAGNGARALTCGLIGRPRAGGAGGGPPAELIRPGPKAIWAGQVDPATLVFRRALVARLPPVDEVGAGALVALATLAAVEGGLLHVNHPVAGLATTPPAAADADARMLRAEADAAAALQALCGGLEIVHATDSPRRDQWLQQLLPLMLRASEAWTAARRALDVRRVRPEWRREP